MLFPYILFSQAGALAETGAEEAGTAEAGAGPQGSGRPDFREAERSLLLDDPAPRENAGSQGFALFRMILVLALSAGAIYLAVFFLRRLSRPQAEQNPHLKVLASTHLGSGRYVHAVSVGKEAWLIGSGEGGVRHIADIGDREAVDAMLLDASRKNAEVPGLRTSFEALLAKFSGAVSKQEQNRLETMRQRRERFKRF